MFKQFFVQRKREREIKALFFDFLTITEFYCRKHGREHESFLVNKLRNEVIFSQASRALPFLFDSFGALMTEELENERDLNGMLQDLKIPIEGEEATVKFTELYQKNVCDITERCANNLRTMFWDIVYISSFYPYQGSQLFSLTAFARKYSTNEIDYQAVITLLEECIKDVNAFN